MRMIPNETKRGPSGAADVIFTAKKVRVTFTDGNFSGQTFEFDPKKVPVKVQSGEYSVRLNPDGSEVYGISPLNATVVVVFDRFAAPENQPPVPKHKTGTRNGKNGPYPFDEFTCTALGTIVAPKEYKGMTIAMPFVYPFVADDDGYAVIKGTGNKQQQWNDFLRVANGGDFMIKFSDNLLPLIQTSLQKKKRQFIVVVKGGWPDSYSDPIGGTIRKTPASKKATTKSKAKK